jgi:hypothetical protein
MFFILISKYLLNIPEMKTLKSLLIIFLLLICTSVVRAQVTDPQIAAQGQLDAYNKQDIEAFLSWYSEDVEVYNFPDELLYKGKDKMRERYSNAWKQNPAQRVIVTDRLISGNTVIDREHVTGRANGIENYVIAIYKVDKGLINKVWFIRD